MSAKQMKPCDDFRLTPAAVIKHPKTTAPRNLIREPLVLHRPTIVTPILEFDQWQMIRFRGVVLYGRVMPEDCRSIRIETGNEVLIAYSDEVEGLGLADEQQTGERKPIEGEFKI